MKKIFALLLAVAVLITVGTVAAFAALPDGISSVPGGYSDDMFYPVGELRITWDPDAAYKLDLTDGDMTDWVEAAYDMFTIDVSNMVYWVNNTTDGTGVPEGWSISSYFVADAEWLYIGFYVADPAFAYILDGDYHSGDAIQLCIDFGNKTGDLIETDPYDTNNSKNIFYSFGCVEDGAPIKIMRQESGDDGWLSEENGDGVRGASRKTNTGWSAEFALSWEQLYEDYTFKPWDDPTIYIGGDRDLPLEIGCCLYYLDNSETGRYNINWAAGTTNGITDNNGTPHVSWTVYDNGIGLYLPYEEGMDLYCSGIQVLEKTVTTSALETEAEPVTEPTQETGVETEDAEPDTEAADQPTPPKTENRVLYEAAFAGREDSVNLPGVLMLMLAASIVVVAIAFKKKL
ncbi:MAG: hypothetical protein IJA91_01770 [Clostridia bacterium]|nr:hypothetical protein [Clostridia bacterium]